MPTYALSSAAAVRDDDADISQELDLAYNLEYSAQVLQKHAQRLRSEVSASAAPIAWNASKAGVVIARYQYVCECARELREVMRLSKDATVCEERLNAAIAATREPL